MTSLFRRSRAEQRVQQAMIATTPLRREQESDVDALIEQVDAAVSGDLIAMSPTLSARLDDIQTQIDALAQ